MSLTPGLTVAGGRIVDWRIHGRPHDGAGQPIPLFAGARVDLGRRRQTSGKPAPLDLEVFRGIVIWLVLPAFAVVTMMAPVLAVAPIPVVAVSMTSATTPSAMGQSNLPICSTESFTPLTG